MVLALATPQVLQIDRKFPRWLRESQHHAARRRRNVSDPMQCVTAPQKLVPDPEAP